MCKEPCSTADEYGEYEVAVAPGKTCEADECKSDGIVEQELRPMCDIAALNILKQTIDKTCKQTPFYAVAVGVDHQRQHTCESDRAAEGH